MCVELRDDSITIMSFTLSNSTNCSANYNSTADVAVGLTADYYPIYPCYTGSSSEERMKQICGILYVSKMASFKTVGIQLFNTTSCIFWQWNIYFSADRLYCCYFRLLVMLIIVWTDKSLPAMDYLKSPNEVIGIPRPRASYTASCHPSSGAGIILHLSYVSPTPKRFQFGSEHEFNFVCKKIFDCSRDNFLLQNFIEISSGLELRLMHEIYILQKFSVSWQIYHL